MTPQPKPVKREKAPRKRIRTRRPLGTVRKEAKATGDLTDEQWQQIVQFYIPAGWLVCAYCERRIAGSQACQEHIIPITRGGRHTASNVCVACLECNDRKGTQTWEPKLRHPLMEPR